MSRSYLVPEVITDVNNRVTTVYRKVDPDAPAGAVLPPPFATTAPATPKQPARAPRRQTPPVLHRMFPSLAKRAAEKERAELISDIKALTDRSFFSTADTPTMHKIRDILEAIPKRARSAFMEAIDRDLRHMSHSAPSVTSVDVIHANLDIMPVAEYDGALIVSLQKSLTMARQDTGLKVKNIDAHLEASWSFPYSRTHSDRPYDQSVSMVGMVAKHPEHVEYLMSYARLMLEHFNVAPYQLATNDIPEKLIEVAERFPGREEDILNFMKERGPEVPDAEVLEKAFTHHSALGDGWL
jgi:hypothetical protein